MIGQDAKFHHLGLAVSKPARAFQYLSGLNYKIGATVRHEAQFLDLTYCTSVRMPDVEVVTPTRKRRRRAVVTNFDTGIYYQCYETESIHAAVVNLQAAGWSIKDLSRPERTPLFGDRLMTYLDVSGLGLVGLMEACA